MRNDQKTQMVVFIPKVWIEKKRKQAKQAGLVWSKFAREEIVRILMEDMNIKKKK